MLHQSHKSKRGFTIIEVMIVLAIAGLIMLIIFLAVPALQRNARNTQRKNDAAAIGSAIANFIANNGGTLPTTFTAGASANQLVVGTTAVTNTETATLGFYANTAVAYQTTTTLPAASTSNVVVVGKDSCNATNNGVNAAGSSPRSEAIVFWTENGTTTPVEQCVEQ